MYNTVSLHCIFFFVVIIVIITITSLSFFFFFFYIPTHTHTRPHTHTTYKTAGHTSRGLETHSGHLKRKVLLHQPLIHASHSNAVTHTCERLQHPALLLCECRERIISHRAKWSPLRPVFFYSPMIPRRDDHIEMFSSFSVTRDKPSSPPPPSNILTSTKSLSLEKLTDQNKKYSKIHLAGLQIQKCTEQ